MINHSLETPLRGYLLRKYLHDLDAACDGHVEAGVVAINTYPGHAPTLTVLVTAPGDGEGSVFTYLPFDAFTLKPEAKAYPFRSLVYHECREGRVDFAVIAALPRSVQAFLRPENLWLAGEYLGTLDWYDGNDLLNIVKLENGQLAALPFHKLKFGDAAPRRFAHYRKLHAEWRM